MVMAWPTQPRRGRGTRGQETMSRRSGFCDIFTTIIDHPNYLVLTPRALKRASVMTWHVGLDGCEPHRCVTEFAKRMMDHPQPRKYLIRSHATQPISLDFE
jgi:hypothetical protein